MTQKDEPTWQTPEDFGLYVMKDDGSFTFLRDVLFWAFIVTNSYNEIHLCGVDEDGLYGINIDTEGRYDTGRSIEDVSMCMRYYRKKEAK